MEQVLRHEPASDIVWLGEDAIGTGEEAREDCQDVEEMVEGRFGVGFEGSRKPVWLGEVRWGAV